MKTRVCVLLLLIGSLLCQGNLIAQDKAHEIDLSGIWRFQLDPMGFGKTPGSELYSAKVEETIVLPSSTDQGGKGIRTTAWYIDRLTRKFEYQGAAWYQREIIIPSEWSGKEIFLNLERCHWETTVYIDGKEAGTGERLSTPNRFLLTRFLSPGIHTLTLCINNQLKYPMDQWNHGTTEYTQTNWNGVVGKITLEAKERSYIHQVDVYPNLSGKKIRVKVQMTPLKPDQTGIIRFLVRDEGGKIVGHKEIKVDSLLSQSAIQQELVLGDPIKTWDEFSPYLYQIETKLEAGRMQDVKTTAFGMREVRQGKHHLQLNGSNIHLRGVLDCAVFPRTGYPSVSVPDWKHIFHTIKSYGMNHVRFHSWCPPEAAFTAADEVGLYLQVELPMWIKDAGKYPERCKFFEEELYAVLNAYGNHPSFLLFCNGNELEGDFSVLEDLIQKGQDYDSRHLYSASTARTHVKADQYYVSHVTTKGGITVYEGKPSTDWDKAEESAIDVPVIAHESGQRCMYPNFEEMKKYTGVLEPRNFEVFRERLAQNGMLHQAHDFFKATGAHTVLQYKEVNEALLRTPDSGGFQLLGLADFPGQGSAFVGILDAFWESKGLVTPEKFRESCAPTVLLARFPQRIYYAGDTLATSLEIYHFGKDDIRNRKLSWVLETEDGKSVKQGSFEVKRISKATVSPLQKLSIPFPPDSAARKLTLKIELAGICRNEWDFWVYPLPSRTKDEGFYFTTEWNERTMQQLEEGANVLLVPQKVPGRKTRFASHFWNPIMFKWEPMIVGTLIENKHPAFNHFPTSYYADWQWWDILNHSVAMDLSGLKDITPLIQSIDTYEINRKLGIAFEAKVGKGKLFVLAVNIEEGKENRMATAQLLASVKSYIGSGDFNPVKSVPLYELERLFATREEVPSTPLSDAATDQLLNK